MVGDVVAAFPKAHVAASAPPRRSKNEAPIQPQLLPAVVRAYPTVGFHFDNMGAIAPADGNNLPYLKPGGSAEDLEAWERWKTAPVISEWWNLPNATVGDGEGHDRRNARLGPRAPGTSSHRSTPATKREYQELLKLAGFRDQLDQVEVSTLHAGQPATSSRRRGRT